MADLLTPSVNVPAEREKLRRLRNEIAADVAHREAIQRKYSPRGFPLLPDVHPLEAQGKPSDGKAPLRPVCAGSSVGVSAAASDMRPTHAGCCGRCSGTHRLERKALTY
jgi:hypothetical protein